MTVITPEQLTKSRCALGQQLANRREAAGLTQAQLARLTGYARSTIANLETGRSSQPRTCWVRYDQLLDANGALLAGYDHYASLTQQYRRRVAQERERQRDARAAQWLAPPHDSPGPDLEHESPSEQHADRLIRPALEEDPARWHRHGQERHLSLHEHGGGSTVRDHDGHADRAFTDLIEWLAHRSGIGINEIYKEVSRRVQFKTTGHVPQRTASVTPRHRFAQRLIEYYDGWDDAALTPYQLDLDNTVCPLSVITKPEWTRLRVPLDSEAEQVDLADERVAQISFDEVLVGAAVERIAEVALSQTRVVDGPLYRLLSVHAEPTVLRATFGATTFVEYALTMDLLEQEVRRALSSDSREVAFPVRRRLLPDLTVVADTRHRVCAGGTVALFAAAREANHRRARPDFALVIQQRSSQVLNASGNLATIPKAFHEPLTDPREDVRLSATILRELEEELFSRTDVDSVGPQTLRLADPMHSTLLSAPMRWLMDRRGNGAWRIECVGLGINLVSGNYEFACLVLIEDPEWWRQFGGMIMANWETDRLQLYSSEDEPLLRRLMADSAWSNEGLFAFAEGIRRVQEITGRSWKVTRD